MTNNDEMMQPKLGRWHRARTCATCGRVTGRGTLRAKGSLPCRLLGTWLAVGSLEFGLERKSERKTEKKSTRKPAALKRLGDRQRRAGTNELRRRNVCASLGFAEFGAIARSLAPSQVTEPPNDRTDQPATSIPTTRAIDQRCGRREVRRPQGGRFRSLVPRRP